MNELDKASKRGSIYEVFDLNTKFFKDLLDQIASNKLDYKTRVKFYQERDRALIAGLVLTGLRASEIVLLKKDQVLSDGDLVRIHKARTVKNSDLRVKIPLPTRHILGNFTRILTGYLDDLPPSSFIYPSGKGGFLNYNKHLQRQQVYKIVRSITGKYPHYYRAVNASIWSRIFEGNAYMLKSYFGWKNLNSSSPYVKTIWEKKEGEINAVF